MKMHKFKPRHAYDRPALAVALVAAGIGVYFLGSSGAATYAVHAEAESGVAAGNVGPGETAGASGGDSVGFGSTPAPTSPPPASGQTCPPFPAFPDENCTGPTGTLSVYNGPMTFSTPGQVIENVQINTSGMTITADNVTFRNCKIIYTGALDAGFAMIYMPAGVTGTVFERCELDGRDRIARTLQGIDGVTVRNCNIHHTGNGIEVGTNITMTDTYMHDIHTPAGLDWHTDGIQSDDSASNITIVHNTILLTGDETGAINIVSNGGGGTFSDILIQHNLMAGGGYTIYLGSAPARTVNVRAIDNHLSTRYFSRVGYWGPWYGTYLTNVVRSGNVIHETGEPSNG